MYQFTAEIKSLTLKWAKPPSSSTAVQISLTSHQCCVVVGISVQDLPLPPECNVVRKKTVFLLGQKRVFVANVVQIGRDIQRCRWERGVIVKRSDTSYEAGDGGVSM